MTQFHLTPVSKNTFVKFDLYHKVNVKLIIQVCYLCTYSFPVFDEFLEMTRFKSSSTSRPDITYHINHHSRNPHSNK